jgi:hypothetical protein
MSAIPMILLIISFLTYSISLWAAGFFQKRKLNDQHIQAAEFGDERYYLTFVIVTLISLMIFFGINFYISTTSSFRLIPQPSNVQYQQPQMQMSQPQMQMSQPQMTIPRSPSQYSQYSGPYR